MINRHRRRRYTLLQEYENKQGIVLHSSATQSGSINKKYHEMNFELKILFTGLT